MQNGPHQVRDIPPVSSLILLPVLLSRPRHAPPTSSPRCAPSPSSSIAGGKEATHLATTAIWHGRRTWSAAPRPVSSNRGYPLHPPPLLCRLVELRLPPLELRLRRISPLKSRSTLGERIASLRSRSPVSRIWAERLLKYYASPLICWFCWTADVI